MSYIGSTPTTQSFIAGTDYFNGTGSATAFTLSRSVVSVNDIQATVNNVVQVPNDAYTVSGTTITFTSAPSAGTNNVYVRYLSTTTQSITPSQNTVSYSTLNSDNQSKLGISFKNRIINGAMVIDQRNAGAAVTNAGGTAYTLDRWYLFSTSLTVAYSVQQSSTAPTGFSNSLKATITSSGTSAASDRYFIAQAIEGYNTADLGWGTANAKTVTLSFWVYSSLTGTFGGAIGNSDQDYSYPFTYTISAANTWTQATVTITGPTTGTWVGSTNGTGLKLYLNIATGSTRTGTAGAWAAAYYTNATGSVNIGATNGATIYWTGVQLEVGTQATTFDYRSIGTELSLCQRYYFKNNPQQATVYAALGTGYFSTTGNLNCYFSFPVTMRTQPTFAYSSISIFGSSTSSSQTVSSVSGSYSGYTTGLYTLNSGTTAFAVGGGGICAANTSDSTSWISLSAEL